MDLRNKVDNILNAHSIKAQQSSYDRDTCVLAVLSARETMLGIPNELTGDAYSQAVLEALEVLFDRYHDPDGEFTSGRSVIGAILDDIRAALEE